MTATPFAGGRGLNGGASLRGVGHKSQAARGRLAVLAAAKEDKDRPVVIIDNYDSFTYNLSQVRGGATRSSRAAAVRIPAAAIRATAAPTTVSAGPPAPCSLSPTLPLTYRATR